MTIQRDEKPLEQITREELIEEVQRECVVVGAHQAESDCRDTCLAQLEQELGLADAEIERWKHRCRQEIAFRVQCQQSLTSVVEERDDLKEHIHRLEAELARSYTNVKSVYERWTVAQKRLEKLQQEMYDLEEDNATLKERITQLQTAFAAVREQAEIEEEAQLEPEMALQEAELEREIALLESVKMAMCNRHLGLVFLLPNGEIVSREGFYAWLLLEGIDLFEEPWASHWLDHVDGFDHCEAEPESDQEDFNEILAEMFEDEK